MVLAFLLFLEEGEEKGPFDLLLLGALPDGRWT